MTASTFIARILGPVLVVVGLGTLLQTEAYRMMGNDFLKNAGLVYFLGILSLAIGLAILNSHNLWVRDWRVIITIFGWLAVLGGIFRLLATSWTQELGLEALTHPSGLVVGAVVEIVLGGFLTIMGYQDIWNPEAASREPNPGPSPANAAAAPKPARRQKPA
jgi:hypothetical protein